MASKLSLFFAELKRRKVYRVAAVYAAVGVAISIAVPDLFGAFGFPDWAAPLIIVVVAIGLPIALVLAWAYEVRPEELKPAETSEEELPATAEPSEPSPPLCPPSPVPDCPPPPPPSVPSWPPVEPVAGGLSSGVSGGACEVLGSLDAQPIRRTTSAATEHVRKNRFMVCITSALSIIFYSPYGA